jgi:tripartite-type tricarboxylate transporter receptor subunit TctC
MVGELFKMMTGIKMVHLPYRGAGPALIDVLSGQVEVIFATLPSSIGHIRGGKLRPPAVTLASRSDALPDVPAMREYASRDRRQAQSGNQRDPRRSEDEGSHG